MRPDHTRSALLNALRQLGVLATLAGVTVLLTLLFSFLGTLSITVVMGVIMGSTRRWQWQSLPVSLVFPTVMLGLSHYSKIEVPQERVNLIALVCVLAFWGVFGMMFCMRFFEQKESAPPATPPGQVASNVSTSGVEDDALRAFSLAALRGSLWASDKHSDPSGQRKTLQIEGGKFELSVSAPGGRTRVVARGEVIVEQPRPDQLVINLSEQRDAKPDP